jgi:hypothetical protein
MGYRMNYCIKLTGVVFLLFFAGAPTPIAQSQWQYEGSQYEYGLRKAFIEQKSIVLGSTCSTRLQFNATQDHGKNRIGILALEFTVSPMSSIKGFDFEYFDGPGAPVGAQKLMRVTVTKRGRSFIHMLSLIGILGSEYVDDGFVFHTNNLTRNKQGKVRKVLDEVLQGAESLEVDVIDGKDHAIVLSATFPLTGSKPAIEALLKGI